VLSANCCPEGAEAERTNDLTTLLRLKQQKLEIDRKLAEQ